MTATLNKDPFARFIAPGAFPERFFTNLAAAIEYNAVPVMTK
jgi:hypothetical protein